MTIQTKHFIDVSDLLALRFTCKNCDATLSLLLTDDKLSSGQEREKHFIDRCPSCGRNWFDIGHNSYELTVTRATAAINKLSDLLGGQMGKNIGASVVLEIKSDAVPPDKVGVAS